MNKIPRGAAGLQGVGSRSCCACSFKSRATLAGLWKQAALWLLVAASLWLGGCTPAYQGIYPDDSAVVTGSFIAASHDSECSQEEDWQCSLYVEDQSSGFLRNYRVKSEFGVFSAEGGAMLDYRLDEIDAIAELDDFSTLEIFFDTFSDRALSPVRKVTNLATQPVSTVKRLPGGYLNTLQQPVFEILDDVEDVHDDYQRVRKISRKISEKVAEQINEKEEGPTRKKEPKAAGIKGKKESDDDPSKKERLYARAKEEAHEEIMDYFDLTDREKKWMREVGMDPDSKNPVLYDHIRRVALTERLASYSTTFVTFPVMPGAAWSANMMSLAWSEPDYDLTEYLSFNNSAATDQPVQVNYAKRLKKNKAYPRSVRERMASTLKRFSDKPGIDAVSDSASNVGSEGEARFFTASMEMAVWYQDNHNSVIGLIPVGPAVMVQLSDSRNALMMPGGITDWTPRFASAADELGIGRPELWFREDISSTRVLEMAYDGWLARDDWRGISVRPVQTDSSFTKDFIDLLTKTNRP